jgi:hypothetical protein
VSDQKPDKIPATPALLHRVADYQRAKEARARWAAEEKAIKEELFETLGYDPDDPKPTPLEVVDPIAGVTMFRVNVGTWRGFDVSTLKEDRPDIYAQYETSKATKSIK